MFWITDLDQQKVVYVSPAYERLWGLSAAALLADPKAWRAQIHPDDRAAAATLFDRMLAGGQASFELVYRMRAQAGGWRWVRDKAWLVEAGTRRRLCGIMTDITAEKAAAERQNLVARELHHRLRNAFTLMQSILRLSARHAASAKDLAAGVEARLQGSAAATDLALILRDTLAPYPAQQIALDGPPVAVGAGGLTALHMAFHELATNAAKYGALSTPAGRVAVRWGVEGQPPGGELVLLWTETAGPAVLPLARQGFGTVLIEQALAADFGGRIALRFPPAGVECEMRLPLSDQLALAPEGLARTAAMR